MSVTELLDELIAVLANALDGEPLGDTGHAVPCELDAAYTRNVTERFNGLAHPPDHDGVQTLVDVEGDPVTGCVDFTIPDAGIRLNFTSGHAEDLAVILLAQAARTRREAA